MNREKAVTLIGSRVRAWTAANGIYIGILETVHSRPWRGKVRITGVIEPAVAWDVKRSQLRTGFRPGEIIDVGGCNIHSTEEAGLSYRAAMEKQLHQFRIWFARNDPKDNWWLERSIPALEQLIAQEPQEES